VIRGRSHPIRFAEEGATIVALDSCAQILHVMNLLATADELAETVREVEKLDQRCLAYEVDARDSARMHEVVGQAVGELGQLDR
jgi:NAD(P)-dependent dehydrogenase (short-subunit alcohol dehydrogenase family)